jgi:hypothetical protein
MKRWAVTVAAATFAMMGRPSFAQDGVPAPPPLTAAQSQQVQSEMEAYRRETDARVTRGEITPDEAQRLLQWREWQLAQQAAGLAPVPPPPSERVAVMPPGYAPPPAYYYPYYYPAPGPYYGPYFAPWGLSVCAGRAYRHGFGSFCI